MESPCGDKVGIAYKKAADGKLTAMTVNDGKKPPTRSNGLKSPDNFKAGGNVRLF